MPEYMLLLYASESADEAERAADGGRRCRCGMGVTESLRKAGLWSPKRAFPFGRERDDGARPGDETKLTDGPFAVTKEVLAGYYVLECADLDEAPRQAARLPGPATARSRCGPSWPMSEIPRPDRCASAS